MSRPTAPAEVLSLNEFLRIVRQHALVIVTVFLFCLAVAVAYTGLFTDRWYLATNTIRVEKPEGEVSLFQSSTGAGPDRGFINDQFEILQSRKILDQVITRLALNRRLAEMLGLANPLETEQSYKYLTREMLEVESRTGTSLIDIGVWATQPKLAAEIANEIAQVYERDRIEFATSGQTQGINKLNEELENQARKVMELRDRVEKLRLELGVSGIDANLQSAELEVDALRQMERTLAALQVEATAKRTRWEQFRSVPPEGRIHLVNSELIPDPNIQNLLQAYLIQEQTYAQLRGRLGEAHPDYIAAAGKFATLRQQLDDLLAGFEKALEISYRESEARVTAIATQLKGVRSDQIRSASGKFRLFEEAVKDLREEETVLRSMRLAVRQREIDFQVPKRTIEVLSEAQPPERYSRPNWLLNLCLAAFSGVVLGLAAAFLLEFIDTSYRTVEDLEKDLGLPLLGVVARRLVRITSENYNGFEAEPYRVIQTGLELGAQTQHLRVLTLQSAGPGEGKSTSLHNLAACLALSGRKVLIIDTDLRRPSQHRICGLDRMPGLVEHFTGGLPLQQCIRPSGVPGLEVITSGESGPKSISLLQGRQLRELVDRLKGQYDHILLDSPPIIGISDASLIARLAEGLIFVVQHGRNPRAMTRRARQILGQVDARVLGVVFNQVPPHSGEDYSYYTSAYAYSHAGDLSKAPSKAPNASPASPDAGDKIRFRE